MKKPSADSDQEKPWDLVITRQKNFLNVPFRDIWRFRDLLFMLIKRDIIVLYKQTVLGPLWFFIQPVLTALVYVLVFGRIAKLSTDGLPPILFYLSGTIVWNYFQESFNATSKTFTENANLFGKVYFPRLVVPLSKVVAGLLRFLIQFGLFLGFYLFFLFKGQVAHPNTILFLVPVMILIMAMLGLGLGILFTSLTTKYRDLVFLIQFMVQLLMYATPVIYPLSSVPDAYKPLISMNPMTPVMEGFRYAFLGIGSYSHSDLLISLVVSTVILIAGLMVFNYTEKDFMDTV